ncbi:MAG TPA: uroporphyrinogen decarboxylase family protein [Syntrophorhabdales bacterium]|nr:uroporphyrinogen decarboxylase family protein [Syntrophorhabdales bacterium]
MDKKWTEMMPAEKRDSRFKKWSAAEGIKFESPQAEAAYKKAIERFRDISLLEKIPDRVPVMALGTFMQTAIYNVSPYEAMYDVDKLLDAHTRFLNDFKPDYGTGPALIGSGKVMEILDYKHYRWPGHNLPKDTGYQYVEAEYMTADEYDALIDDPSDFWVRTFLPRMCGAFDGLKMISPWTDMWEVVLVSPQMIPFGIPPVQAALKAMIDAGNEAMAWIQKIAGFDAKQNGMGYPGLWGGVSKAPFDILADTLRGTRSIMIDMYRQPKKLEKALERVTPLAIKQGLRGADMNGIPTVFMPLHKGADGFMSDEQFKRFYWPSLKETILGLAEQGVIAWLFCEGGYNSRLEYLKELPKYSSFWLFDRTDIVKAKEAIGANLGLGGNIPAGLMLTGTPESVKSYCKNLIDTVGKGGGYLMSWGTALDEGKADTIHAVIDFTKEYGVYKK